MFPRRRTLVERTGEGGRATLCILSGGACVGFSRIQNSEESIGCIVIGGTNWIPSNHDFKMVKDPGAAE